MTARLWWTFRLLGSMADSVAHVPADTEEGARRVLARHSYPGAPVGEWACVGTRVCGREEFERRDQ